MRNILMVVVPFVAVACGYSDDLLLTDLEAGDWERICPKAVDEETTDRDLDCDPDGDGTVDFTVTVAGTTVASCEAFGATLTNPDCTGTFGDWKDCQGEDDLSDDQYCGIEEYTPSAACLALGSCIAAAAE